MTTTKTSLSKSGSTIIFHKRCLCLLRIIHRPSSTSGKYLEACCNICRKSTSLKSRSAILFKRWELSSRSQSPHPGHSIGMHGQTLNHRDSSSHFHNTTGSFSSKLPKADRTASAEQARWRSAATCLPLAELQLTRRLLSNTTRFHIPNSLPSSQSRISRLC